jgi:amino acid transporter
MLIARAIASASLIFTGLTRLPMTASWDHVVPEWFSRLHPKRRTPVNSILFVSVVVVLLILLSMLGVHEQEANQLLSNASTVHYAVAYIALFAIPLVGALRRQMPGWLRAAAAAGLFASAVSLAIAVYPIVDVVSKTAYASKIVSLVVLTNGAGVVIFRAGQRRRAGPMNGI